jgi:hypothetical protein
MASDAAVKKSKPTLNSGKVTPEVAGDEAMTAAPSTLKSAKANGATA